MPAALFEFFEVIAEELTATPSRVITNEDFRINDKDSPLLENLMKELKAVGPEDAFRSTVVKLEEHFNGKGAKLPFEYLPETGRFTATDPEFLSFVNDMRGMRTIGKRARDFECTVAQRLDQRTTGAIHRVGYPRDAKKTRAAFNKHLMTLGFDAAVLYGREKDGGFDILWLLPIGSMPHKPIVSVQCKNSEYNIDDAHKSVATAIESFTRHVGLQTTVHVPCVLFNDYISPTMLRRKPMGFVPLGLTDLAPLAGRIPVELI